MTRVLILIVFFRQVTSNPCTVSLSNYNFQYCSRRNRPTFAIIFGHIICNVKTQSENDRWYNQIMHQLKVLLVTCSSLISTFDVQSVCHCWLIDLKRLDWFQCLMFFFSFRIHVACCTKRCGQYLGHHISRNVSEFRRCEPHKAFFFLNWRKLTAKKILTKSITIIERINWLRQKPWH